MAPVALHLSDEGGNGLAVHVVNDRAVPLTAELELALWRDGEVSVGRARRAIEVPAHAALELPAAALLDGFVDLSYAYRFGPPPCDLVHASLVGTSVQAFHFPVGLPTQRELDLGLAAERVGDKLRVTTRRFAQSISLDFEGSSPDDDFFHLAPGGEREIELHGGAARGTLVALNCATVLTVR
jgi:beta-mannosidase